MHEIGGQLMAILKDKKILLGVTGSISAYKACDLVQRLKEEECQVRVVLTPSAAKLVHPNTFAALTGYKAASDMWTGLETGDMDHIQLARWADIFLVAPCSAHTMGEFAHGLTGSLLSLIYMAYQGPVFIAPAMNTVMLESYAVAKNLNALADKGDVILPTGSGTLACGEVGEGKLLEVSQIIRYLKSGLALGNSLNSTLMRGKKCLIALGHTREKLDDVRFISNRSSGKTGLAIARALWLCGAEVQLLAGHVEEELPPLPGRQVSTTLEFRQALIASQPEFDIIIMSAAIADFIPAETFSGKLKRSKEFQQLSLTPSPDILLEMGNNKPMGQVLVGFALETADPVVNGMKKLAEKKCDWIVINNPVQTATGFGKDAVLAGIIGPAGIIGTTGRGGEPQAEQAALVEMEKEKLAAQLVGKLIGRSMGNL